MAEISIRGSFKTSIDPSMGEELVDTVRISGYDPRGRLIFWMDFEMGYEVNWVRLARACVKGEDLTEVFHRSYGSCTIELRDGVIEFMVSSYGGGDGGGALVFNAMASGCAAGFAQLAADLEEFWARNPSRERTSGLRDAPFEVRDMGPRPE